MELAVYLVAGAFAYAYSAGWIYRQLTEPGEHQWSKNDNPLAAAWCWPLLLMCGLVYCAVWPVGFVVCMPFRLGARRPSNLPKAKVGR